ncbi:hypothetical protein [Deinococcus cellulosilyticus]|uniref:Uncharacterized protein n=1 Tax=Deinococcus cellulosilyticus (strain DSM 18568 / NBRC 106333 / KACC 11606 / 5516J-15) TaxID=1223518 RepID=A0A511N9W6_DEIC1|nr:hypothetical protein [Deinococcus cellulosilyticus]GEM49316.1 hypothetical protein DC3_49510 [Deinococcus cellulosilyticus NBRC 106333 = KACC 11606]
MKSIKTLTLIISLGLLAACGSAPRVSSDPAFSDTAQVEVQKQVNKAPSRLRDSQGNLKVLNYATFYATPTTADLDELQKRDISFVQPNAVSNEQIQALQTIGYAISYLSIGEIGIYNTYYVNGVPKLGWELLGWSNGDPNNHTITGTPVIPQSWVVGMNKNFQAPMLDLTNADARAFLVQQAQALWARQFDGLFLDTADDAEFFGAGTPGTVFENENLILYANRPTYAQMRAGYIATIKALRAAYASGILVQNGGFDLVLDSENSGDGTEGYIDAVMHEVATTRYLPPTTSEAHPTLNGANYLSWTSYYAQTPEPQRTADQNYRINRDQHADAYLARGGVVFAQDFATPDRTDLSCLSYEVSRSHGWIPAYSDAHFQKLYTFPDSTAQIRSYTGCANYTYTVASDFSVTFQPRTVSARPGTSTSTTLNVGAVNGYTSPVKLRFGKLPAGVTGSFSSTQVTPGPTTQVSLTLNIASTTALKTYIVPVIATSAGESMRYDLRLNVVNVNGETVWIANAGNGTVAAYDTQGNLTGTSTENRKASGISQPYDIAVAADGTQFVVENVGNPAAPQPAGRILKYAPFSLSEPLQTLTGLNYPTSAALDSSNNLWVVSSALDWTGTVRGTPRINRFAPNATTPTSGFDFPASSYGYPFRAAIDSQNRLWVTTSYGLITMYTSPLTATSNQAPDLVWSVTGLNPKGLTFDAQGNLYVVGNEGTSSKAVRLDTTNLTLSQFSANADSRILATYTSNLYSPFDVDVDALGNLWVVNSTGSTTTSGSVVRFPAVSGTPSTTPNLILNQSTQYTVGIAVSNPL